MAINISTFVFFDTETTGLPINENNLTKITELSLVAVPKEDISKTDFGSLPKITKKLSILLNPQRTISSGAVRLNGLTNEYLNNSPTFGESFDRILEFFADLPKPVCLVAHNGNNFDYVILLAECKDANVVLPSDLLCCDSKVIFKSILNGTTISFESLTLARELKKADDENTEGNPAEEQHGAEKSTKEGPSSKTQSISDEKVKQNVIPAKEEVESNKVDGKTASKTTVRQGSTESSTVNSEIFSWNSFTLENLCKRLTNKAPNNAHRAEGDCFTLMECVVALKSEFIALSESSCKLLTEIPPLRRKLL